jgi:penicillin-binding protein 1C
MKKYIDLIKKVHIPKYTEDKNTHKKPRKYKKVLSYFIYSAIILFLIGVAFLTIFISTIPLPDITNFDKRVISESTKVYDRTGEVLLYDAHNTIRRTVVDLADININIQRAAIAIEDDQFYNHKGIRIKSIIRAIYATVFKGDTQGGSTLTQQIVKNTLLTKEQSLTRKIKEAIIAIRLEQKLTKDELLEIYLNEAPYSGNIYGVEEASKVYFKKSAKEVSLFEAAYLAAIPKGPTYYNPNGQNRDKLDERAKYVLKRMEDLGYITYEERQNALATPVNFVAKAQTPIKAPHFVVYIRDYLEKKYGKEKVDKEGLRVISTLDFDLQVYAEEEALKEALKNEKDFGGSNIGLVALDSRNGQILSMVGSRDFFDKEIDGEFNITTAQRQPGSSFKPFVYASAFQKGFRPETVIFDTKTEFNTNCSTDSKGRECYSPSNFDNKFKGPLMLKNSLAESRNIPSIKLIYLTGIENVINTARSMGITTLKNAKYYGLPLALGSGEVKLLEITNAYSVFANNGIYKETTPILRIEDKNGNVLEEYKDSIGEQIMPDYVASAISKILSNNELRAPSFGLGSSMNVPGYTVAAKTGTTNENKDAWIIGYTSSVTVGVWVGNNNNKVMKKGGAQLAGPLFNKIISKYSSKVGNEPFLDIPIPNMGGSPVLRGLWWGGESFIVDKISGGLATEFTPEEAKTEKVITSVHDILHWVDKDNVTGGKPENPQKDPQYTNWEYSVQSWYRTNGAPLTTESDIPVFNDPIHSNNNDLNFSVFGIQENQFLKETDTIQLSIDTYNTEIQRIDVFINSRKIKTADPKNKNININLQNEKLKSGSHTLKIKVVDNLYHSKEQVFSFNINKPEVIQFD